MNASQLLEYNHWANTLIGSQIETLSDEVYNRNLGGSFGSMKATILHILESDWIWLNRFKGTTMTEVPQYDLATAKAVNTEWNKIQTEMAQVVTRFSSDQNIEFITRKGQPISMSFDDIVTHISHHGSYHRGQLANMIRMTGEKPVSTDYFIFVLSRGNSK